jgi:hypothetical protein
MRITKSDFENWWGSPVGEEFRKMLRENMEKLAFGNMNNVHARDQVQNAIEVGRFMATNELYNLTYEYLTGEDE